MQEDLIILLEWLNANGVCELFDCGGGESEYFEISQEIITFNKDKSIGNVMENLAKQQNNIRQNNGNLLLQEYETVRKYCDGEDKIDKLLEVILTVDSYRNHIKLANNTIVFHGNEDNKILIVNDFPNEEEDKNNKIFSGEAEILFEKMMKAINVEKSDYNLLNAFFWRLPGGRMPIKQEIEMCRPFIEKIIAILKPKIIVCTGNYSTSTLIEENNTVAKTRGKFFEYTNMYLKNNIFITSIYSPNFLLKNESKKKEAWSDLQMIRAKMKEIFND